MLNSAKLVLFLNLVRSFIPPYIFFLHHTSTQCWHCRPLHRARCKVGRRGAGHYNFGYPVMLRCHSHKLNFDVTVLRYDGTRDLISLGNTQLRIGIGLCVALFWKVWYIYYNERWLIVPNFRESRVVTHKIQWETSNETTTRANKVSENKNKMTQRCNTRTNLTIDRSILSQCHTITTIYQRKGGICFPWNYLVPNGLLDLQGNDSQLHVWGRGNLSFKTVSSPPWQY